MTTTRLALLSCCLLLISYPCAAQIGDTSQQMEMERLDRLEHDLQILQRQVSRGEPVSAPVGSTDLPAGGSASLEVRLSAIEEQLRALSGKFEENQHQLQLLSDKLDKQQKDTDFRFGELSKTSAPDAVAPDKNAKLIKPEDKIEAPSGPTTAGDGVLRLPAKQDAASFATPREHYNYAFRLLNQTQYVEAATAFDSFTKKYPKDPLVGNAFYWEGETYYIRRDYVSAADDFRQGFEALPNGPKAADNLLKLSMSLDALNRDKEACVVLSQIVTKFKGSSTSVTEKATAEQKRINCSK